MMKKLCGVILLIGGLAVGWYWYDRSFYHPTREDCERTDAIAEYVVPEALAPAGGLKFKPLIQTMPPWLTRDGAGICE